MDCIKAVIFILVPLPNQDEVFTVFSKVALSPKEACGVLLGPPCGDGYNPWKQNWTVAVPEDKPPVTPIPLPKVAYKMSSSSLIVLV